MASQWPQSLSRLGLFAGVTLIGVAVASTLYLILPAVNLLNEALLLGIIGTGLLTAATGAAVYGYNEIDGE